MLGRKLIPLPNYYTLSTLFLPSESAEALEMTFRLSQQYRNFGTGCTFYTLVMESTGVSETSAHLSLFSLLLWCYKRSGV
jgi:hypothetical protein